MTAVLALTAFLFLFLGAVLWQSYHFTRFNRTVIVPMTAEDVAVRGVQFGAPHGLRITQRTFGTVLIESEPKINWALFLILLVFCGIACLIAFATQKRENISILATDLPDGQSQLVLQAYVQGRRVKDLEQFVADLSARAALPSVDPSARSARADAIPSRVIDEETASLWTEGAFDSPPPPALDVASSHLAIPPMPPRSQEVPVKPTGSRLRMTTTPPPMTRPDPRPTPAASDPEPTRPTPPAKDDGGSKLRGTMGRKPDA